MATVLKYFAQKTQDGYPIPGTMMGFKAAPKADLVEIEPKNYEALPGQTVLPPASSMRYFVRHKPDGSILPNSLITGTQRPEGRVYEFKLITGVAIVAPVGLDYVGIPNPAEVGEAISYSPSFTTAPTGTVVYTAVGLPTGLSINSTTGVISGTPSSVEGPNTAIITVENEAGYSDFVWDTWTTVDLVP